MENIQTLDNNKQFNLEAQLNEKYKQTEKTNNVLLELLQKRIKEVNMLNKELNTYKNIVNRSNLMN